MRVRQAVISDAKAIAKIHVKTWQCAYRGQMPDSHLDSLSVAKRTERWKEILSNPVPKKKDFVAELDGKVVGFVSVGASRDEDMDESTGEIWAMYVDPNNMHKGVGSALMEKSLVHLRSLGFTKATLWVLDTNEKTIKWYVHKGWRKEGKEKIEKEDTFDLREARYIIDISEA